MQGEQLFLANGLEIFRQKKQKVKKQPLKPLKNGLQRLLLAPPARLELTTFRLGVAPTGHFQVIHSAGKSLKYKGFQRFTHQILLPCDS